jgi:hypothetical protein
MLPSASFTTVDLGDRLAFRVTYERRWLGTLIGLVFVGLALRQAYFHHDWVWLVYGVVGVCGIIADRLHGSEVDIKVSAHGLHSSGNLGRMFSTSVEVAANEFTSVGYEISDEDNTSGLYIRKRWGTTCIAPHLSEEQCLQIAGLIYQRFPSLGTGDTSPGSLLYPESADPITLGLSKG